MARQASSVVRFGSFELNLKTGELRKNGIRLRLPDQAFQIFQLLLEKHGDLVSREELRARLWHHDTFVDFEQGLNRAVNKLREALCDSAGVPRYIETIPRHGYRFIAPLLAANSGGHGDGGDLPRSLAIIPFTNTSGTGEADYFCAGIAESLIYRFAELPSLRVMACATAFRYRNSTLDAQSIGRELNVDAVLTGRAALLVPTGVGNRIDLSAELVDVRDGALLWGHQCNCKLADWFEVQEEMSRAIFESLRLTLTQQQINRVQKRYTSSLEAHQYYMRGVFNWNKREPGAVRRAMEYFQKALEVDPEYAPAYAGLAECFAVSSLYPYCFLPPAQAMPRAKTSALRALELDPELAEAHATLGLVRLMYEWNLADSEQSFARAQQLKPSCPNAHVWFALYCIAVGDLERAHSEAQKVRECDPFTPGAVLPGVTLFYDRQYERALTEIHVAATLEPTYPPVYLFTGFGECALGRPVRAIDWFNTALKLSSAEGANPIALSALGYAYGLAGRTDEAAGVLHQLEEIAHDRYVPSHAFAFVNLGLGRIKTTLDAIEELVRERSDFVIYLQRHAAFDNLRQHPRFVAALKQVYGPRAAAVSR